VVVVGFYIVFIIKFGYFKGFFTRTHVNNTAAFNTVGNIKQFAALIFSVLHHVTQVPALKAFLVNNAAGLKQQLLLDIVAYLCRGSCG
jgi:hypothetical protein